MKKWMVLFFAFLLIVGVRELVPDASGSTVIVASVPGSSITGVVADNNQAPQTMAGDVHGLTDASTVYAISGPSPIIVTPATLEFATATAAPTFTQASESTAIKGADLTVTPQTSTHTTDQGGGNLIVALETPTGTGAESFVSFTRGGTQFAQITSYPGGTYGGLWPGGVTATTSNYAFMMTNGGGTNYCNGTTGVNIQAGGSTGLSVQSGLVSVFSPICGSVNTSAFSYKTASVAITTGTTALTGVQYYNPWIIFTGSLSGNVIEQFPSTVGACWYVDATAVTLNAHTITLQANSVSWATTVGVTNMYQVCYGGAGKLYGTALTP